MLTVRGYVIWLPHDQLLVTAKGADSEWNT